MFSSGLAQLPLVVVIDDELDTVPDDVLAMEPAAKKLQERWRRNRIEYCEHFGLVPVTEETLQISSPVARALFVAPIEWIDHSATLPSSQAALVALERAFAASSKIASLVLLDLQIAYGRLTDEATFDAVDSEFGTRVVLPQILSRFGVDDTGPGNTWTRCPVVVVSGLPKDELDETVRRAGARGMISKHTNSVDGRKQLKGYLAAHGLLPDSRGIIFGQSLPLLNTLAAVRRAARSRSSVLLLGESGTGKELLARYTHDHSPRASRPYGVYHAAGRGDDLQEDELFGHWSGAFTGAIHDQPGLLEELDTGTVFIDEVGDIAPRVQNALMRPLQERQAARIGRSRTQSHHTINLDVKFLFATNKDLPEFVARGLFRHDLLQRISETIVRLPALRDRREDIPILATLLLQQVDDEVIATDAGICRHHLDQDALDYLRSLDYKDGNIRELRSLILQVASANPSEPRLTQTDFRQPERSMRQEHPPSSPSGMQTLRQVDALRRWIIDGPEAIPHGELRDIVASLRGSAPAFIIALLEVAVTAARMDGRPSMARIMTELWGQQPPNTQAARRALSRLLTVDWHGGSIAHRAEQSRYLQEPKVLELVHRALIGDADDDG